jgi:hypothetical protein
MAIISYFIPYLFVFASVTTGSIALALMPAEDEPDKLLAVTKVAGLTILLVTGGALVYFLGTRRRHDRG